MKTLHIQNIKQVDNYHLKIEWLDGITQLIRLCDIQKNCPCASCKDKTTDLKNLSDSEIDEEVRAIRIQSVGRYALKFIFTSGCSMGIYDFEFLRKMEKSHV